MKGFVKNTMPLEDEAKKQVCDLHTAEQSSVRPQCCVCFPWDSGFLQLHFIGGV